MKLRLTTRAFHYMRPSRLGWLALALAGCESPTAPTDHLQTTVELSRTALPRSDTLSVTIALHNRSGYPVTLRGSSGCLLSFQVETTTGGFLGFDSRACPAILEDIVIPAGGSRQATLSWNLAIGTGPLAPGDYHVVAGAVVAGHRGLQARSRPAPVTVLP